ncbi:hypothetical protein, partial [Photorhabdus viridis]|uniref:hypothetical protein n=1 Tax=Photorhabdus viridis TaxID=3163327 RepID=UPI003307BCA7
LEQAKAEKLDESRYRLTWMMPDGLPITWILRTEMGSGPLALLKLRGFTLPKAIFVVTPGIDTNMPTTDDDDWAAE